MTAKEIKLMKKRILEHCSADMEGLGMAFAEIAAQLAEANARGGVFEFGGEAFNRSHIAVVNKAIESQFDVYLVGHSEATFNFIERPGATRKDFIRAWKGE